MQKRVWRVAGAVAMVSFGFAGFALGAASPVAAATGDCTADPPPTTTTTAAVSAQAAAEDAESVIVTGAGPGGGPHVRVIAADDNADLGGFYAYAPNFHGGVFVAAGDVNGDGYDDVVTGAGPGGGPHVRIFNGAPPNVQSNPALNELGGFYAYAPNFSGGVRVAVGDVNGDTKMDIITAPGPGGGPHVRVFNGATVVGAAPTNQVLNEFMAYDPKFTGGVSVAAADLGEGDTNAEIVTGPGPGGGPHVRVFEPNGASSPAGTHGFMAGPGNFSGGVNVAAACVDGVARIAVATASQVSGAFVFRPDGLEQPGGVFYDTEEDPATFEGLGVALGAVLPQGTPPMQVVTAFSDGDPQVLVSPLADAEPLDGFDAYGVVIRITVAVGRL